jgi:hypothetical protein
MRYQLTESSTPYFLRRDRKDRQHLYHDLNNDVRHSRSWCDSGVNLKPAKEMFNPVEELNQLVSVSANIFSYLGRCQKGLRESAMRDTDREKNANARKDCVR